MFDDDSRIGQLAIAKVYATPGSEGATITIGAVDAGQQATLAKLRAGCERLDLGSEER